MKLPYLSLILVYALYALSLQLWKISEFYESRSDRLQLNYSFKSFAEFQFSQGQKILLSYADLYDLELIPGVSDKLGQNILIARERIIADANNKDTSKSYLAFKKALGVGDKIAYRLGQFLIPE